MKFESNQEEPNFLGPTRRSRVKIFLLTLWLPALAALSLWLVIYPGGSVAFVAPALFALSEWGKRLYKVFF